MNIENIISQVIAGILTFAAVWLLRSLYQKLRKVFHATTIKEMTNNSFNAITSFLPAIFSLIVLAWEVWWINPRNIIDDIFMHISYYVIVGNIVVVIGLIKVEELMREHIRISLEIIEIREEQNTDQTNIDRVSAEAERVKAEFKSLQAEYNGIVKEYEAFKKKQGL